VWIYGRSWWLGGEKRGRREERREARAPGGPKVSTGRLVCEFQINIHVVEFSFLWMSALQPEILYKKVSIYVVSILSFQRAKLMRLVQKQGEFIETVSFDLLLLLPTFSLVFDLSFYTFYSPSRSLRIQGTRSARPPRSLQPFNLSR